LLITTHGFAISPGLYKKLPFDAARDFAPVTQLTSSFVVLVTNPQIPARIGQGADRARKIQARRDQLRLHGIGAPPHLLASC